MGSKPVTLGDWYEILKVEDYLEAATYLNKRKSPPEWLPTFLLQWAPEVIVQRELTNANVSRQYIKGKLAGVEKAAAELSKLLEDRAVMKFLQMPPHRRFRSELGTRMTIDEVSARARDAATSPTLARGSGKGNSGAGKAVATDEVSPQQLCAVIIGEVWRALHGAYPIAFADAAAAASAYWTAVGGELGKSFGSNPIGKWTPYFRKLQDEQYLWGRRKEIKRQLLS
jgi:hypothetical protein